MNSTWEAILDGLNDIEENCAPPLGEGLTVQFMVDCLSLINHRLPPPALQVLDLTKAMSSDERYLQAVTDLRHRCWTVVDAVTRNPGESSSQVSAVSASIFLIDARLRPEEREFLNSVVLFLESVNQVEPHLEEELTLLRKHFSKCLSFSSGGPTGRQRTKS